MIWFEWLPHAGVKFLAMGLFSSCALWFSGVIRGQGLAAMLYGFVVGGLTGVGLLSLFRWLIPGGIEHGEDFAPFAVAMLFGLLVASSAVGRWMKGRRFGGLPHFQNEGRELLWAKRAKLASQIAAAALLIGPSTFKLASGAGRLKDIVFISVGILLILYWSWNPRHNPPRI